MKHDAGDMKDRDLRQFGLVLGIVLSGIGFLHFRKDHMTVSSWLFGMGGVSLLAAVIRPCLLRAVYAVFSKVARIIGWVNTRIIIIFVYYLIVTPIGLIMRFFGKDPLPRKIDRRAESYWVKRDNAGVGSHLKKQF
ncbi:MAG: SxtJ family membrane protein [Candidatus Omnitrophota bacterium]